MIEIIPAIMPKSFADLKDKADLVRSLVPLAQIDIMDGKFVKSKSWPYMESASPSGEHFERLVSQEELLPFFDEIDYELDLMIDEPEKHIFEWLPLGASRLIFHIEAIKNIELFFAHDIWKEGARDIGGQKVIEVGLAINAGTAIEEIIPHLGKIDMVQCMGIEKIGYQGEPFDERVLEMINQLRTLAPNLPISVDGGVNFETAPLLRAAGATRLVSGSAVFGAEDIAIAIETLKSA